MKKLFFEDQVSDLGRYQKIGSHTSTKQLQVAIIFVQLFSFKNHDTNNPTKYHFFRTTLFYFASLVVFVVSLYDVTDDCYKLTNQVLKQSTSHCL